MVGLGSRTRVREKSSVGLGLGSGLDIDFRETEVSGNRTWERRILAKAWLARSRCMTVRVRDMIRVRAGARIWFRLHHRGGILGHVPHHPDVGLGLGLGVRCDPHRTDSGLARSSKQHK